MCEGDRGLEHLGNVLLLLIHTFSVLSLQLKKTTVTLQVSHRHVVVVVFFTLINRASTIPSNIRGCQSGTWSQRGTKVNGSHHGDNPLLRPAGIQIATKNYATLQAMASTNNKMVHQTSFTHSISRAASIDSDCCRLPTTSVLSNKSDEYVPTSFDQQFRASFSRPHIVKK